MSDYNTPTVMSGSQRRITGALVADMLIGTRYHIIRLLGRGGFGAVYLASDNRFPSRRVAVKEMSDARLNPKNRMQAIAHFRQEANLLSSLQHPNLPAVSDFLEEGGKAYLVMDFIDGQTLEEVQKATGGPLDEARVMGWTLQICEVLEYLHRQPQPIIFRDLKPPNTMVTPTGQIKLIDFGIARIFRAEAEKDTNWLGSQGYAAPEQYGLEQTDARTDIYACGAMLYTLLTNQEPLASFARVVNPGSLAPPRQLNPRISQGVERVILTAMQVEKRQRYQSAREMAQAIANLGFFTMRTPSGNIAGPDALTFPDTQPGGSPSLATMNQASTRLSAPGTLTAPPTLTPGGLTQTRPGSSSTPVPQLGSAPTSPSRTPQTGPTLFPPAQPGSPTMPMPGQPGSGPIPPVSISPSSPVQPPARPAFPPPGGWTDSQSGGARSKGISRRMLLVGGGIVALAGATGIYFVIQSRSGSASSNASGTVTVNLAYSTEKADWLKPAAIAFNAASKQLQGSNKLIQIQLNDLGSVDSVEQILSGQIKPVAWSPASTLEVNRLNYKWQQARHTPPLVSYTDQFQPTSLVKSPLVLASWRERAQILLNHYRVPTLDWDQLSLAFQVGDWSQVGGQAGWGPVKFGQTLPTQSNSGLLTIALLGYHYYKEQRGLTMAQVSTNAPYWPYLGKFEAAVTAFGHSSGTYLTKDAIGYGPAQADIIATYESLVLTTQAQAQRQQHQPLLISYPSVNLLSDHPFVILQGDWVTPEQKQAALQFRDFLLEKDQQRQALLHGFRPVDISIALQDTTLSNNPFDIQRAIFPNRQPDPLLAQAQVPDGNTVDALITNWSLNYSAPATTDG